MSCVLCQYIVDLSFSLVLPHHFQTQHIIHYENHQMNISPHSTSIRLSSFHLDAQVLAIIEEHLPLEKALPCVFILAGVATWLSRL